MGFLSFIAVLLGGYSALSLLVAAYDETINASQLATMKHYHWDEFIQRRKVKGVYLVTLLMCSVYLWVRHL